LNILVIKNSFSGLFLCLVQEHGVVLEVEGVHHHPEQEEQDEQVGDEAPAGQGGKHGEEVQY